MHLRFQQRAPGWRNWAVILPAHCVFRLNITNEIPSISKVLCNFFFIFEIWAHHNLSHPTNYPFHASFIVVRSFCLYTQFVKAITVYQFYEVLARKIWINKKKTFAIQVTMGGPDFCCVQAVRGAPLESVTLQRFIFQAIFEFFDK